MKKPVLQIIYLLTIAMTSVFLISCNSQNVQQSQAGQCPQIRTTEMASAQMASQVNPLLNSADNINAGEKLYQGTAKPLACIECHGEDGDGNGPMANMFEPSPRNFTCAETISKLPDGQLFWIIKNGSIGTSMPAFDKLSDDEIWQLTLYIRTFNKNKTADVVEDTAILEKENTSL